jgi:hypothetical protein
LIPSGLPEPQRLASERRQRVRVDRYLTVHDATLREFEHFIEQSTISVLDETDEVLVEGRLYCPNSVYLDVVVVLEMDKRRYVNVLRYTFHAGIAKAEDRSIFRYDNAHVYTREGHPDPHHKHRFDIVTGNEIVPPEWIGAANQPTLRSVLAELEQWCIEVGESL